MQIELSNMELYDILKDGSTNQRNFIKDIDDNNLDIDDVFETIENTLIECDMLSTITYDIRSLLNGGVLYIDNKENENALSIELDNNVYLIIE